MWWLGNRYLQQYFLPFATLLTPSPTIAKQRDCTQLDISQQLTIRSLKNLSQGRPKPSQAYTRINDAIGRLPAPLIRSPPLR